jgi:hypothetical protein
MRLTWKLLKTVIVSTAGVLLISCAAGSDDNAVNMDNTASDYSDITNIYDTLTIDGNFAANIADYKLLLKKEGQSQTVEFTLIEPTTTAIHVFIPKDFTPGKYAVLLSKSSGSATTLADGFSRPLEIDIRKRPVILSASATSFKKGASIVLNGENFLNTSGNASYDPKIWIMAVGYTNTVNTVVVNGSGTVANVTVSSNLNPGAYELYLTTGNGSTDIYEPWSNPVYITIIP